MNTGHWTLTEGIELKDDSFGFIYLITKINPIGNEKKYYVGKKQMFFKTRKKPLKNKKRARLGVKISDWPTYCGSCKELNADILQYGKENFSFSIIRICNSKSSLAYEELKEQIYRKVLEDNEYYNSYIQVRLNKIKV